VAPKARPLFPAAAEGIHPALERCRYPRLAEYALRELCMILAREFCHSRIRALRKVLMNYAALTTRLS
jgi:hypothetical protein